MKILIAGANGQLGRELTRKLNREMYTLLLTDVDEMDITCIESVSAVIGDFMPDIVINCAAFTNVDACEDPKNLEIAKSINTLGPENISKVCTDIGAKMIHISTDYIFDGLSQVPYVEEDQPNPKNIYGLTKMKAEIAVIANCKKHFILRTAWLYGDGKNFVNTMLQLSKKTNRLMVVNDQFGSPTSTNSLADSIILLMSSDKYGIYHATCEGSCSWYEFAQEIFHLSDINITVNPCASSDFVQKATRPKYSVLSNKNLKAKFGYIFPNWKDELRLYLKKTEVS